MGQARLHRRAAHAAPRAGLALPVLRTARPRHGSLLPAPLSALVLGLGGGSLALLALLGPDAPAPASAQPALTANAALAPAPLDPERGNERASRSRRAAAPEPAPVYLTPVAVLAAVPTTAGPATADPTAAGPATVEPAAPVLRGCDGKAHDVDGYANGRLPTAVLCELPGGSGERLRPDAAVAFLGLAAGYQAAFDEPICLTDGYRTLGEQQQLRRSKPRFAARPGSSEHGWGLAVDLSCGVQSFRTEQHAWMVENAGTYGWFLPDWAQRGGSRPEPWHWEYSGA